MPDHGPSGALAKALTDNARLRDQLARQKRQAKADSEAHDKADSWAQVRAEESRQRASRAIPGRLILRSVPCGCFSGKTDASMAKYKVLRCFHCTQSFSDVKELKAHAMKEHHGIPQGT